MQVLEASDFATLFLHHELPLPADSIHTVCKIKSIQHEMYERIMKIQAESSLRFLKEDYFLDLQKQLRFE